MLNTLRCPMAVNILSIWYIHKMEYYIVIKITKAEQRHFTNITVKERSQREKAYTL